MMRLGSQLATDKKDPSTEMILYVIRGAAGENPLFESAIVCMCVRVRD